HVLSGLTNLMALYLDGNQIVDITPLLGLTKLGEVEFEWRLDKREGVRICLGLSGNQIHDISPLVTNWGLSQTDGIDLRGNPLSSASLDIYIPQLEKRGVAVLHGDIVLHPVLSITPDPSLDFGNVIVGESRDLDFTVTNTGGGTLTGSATVPAGPFSIVGASDFSLVAGANASITVRFSPTAAGSFSETVSFTSNGGDLTRGVSGTGVPPGVPVLSITPIAITASLEEGTGWTDIGTINVTNPGGGTLNWSATDDKVWLEVTPTSGTTTTETDAVTVRATTADLTIGTHTGTISFTGAGTTQDVSVTLTVTDTLSPILTITTPAHNERLATASVTVKGTATDAGRGDSGISRVKVNGLPAPGGTATGSGTANWQQTIILNPGTNTITVVAFDDSPRQNKATQTISVYFDPLLQISARIDDYEVHPREVTVGNEVTLDLTFTNTSDREHTFGVKAVLRSPDGRRTPLILESVTVAPDRSGSVQWTSTIDRPGRWDVVFGVWGVPTNPPRNLLDQTGWVAEYITATEDPTPLPVPRFLTLPFRDVDIKIQQGWIYTWDPDPGAHKGIDYIKGEVDQLPWQSFDVVAAADGRAIRGSSPSWGTYVYIHHYERAICGNNYHTLYAHLESVNPKISDTEWTPVRRGEFIGRAGATGVKDRYGNPQPTWVHLHFELHIGDARAWEKAHNRIDPYDLYKTREYYPGGQKYTRSGQNHLWTSDPPTQAPAAHPVITSPLEITPVKEFYRAGDLLTAQFTIANKGTELITFNVLVVGGRDPAGNIVDFDKAYNITLNPGDSYNYLGSLILPDRLGEYYFFIAYQTPDGKWHSDIDVKIDGEIIDTPDAIRFTVRDISVVWEGYIDPPPTTLSLWDEIGGPWEGWGRRLSKIAVHPNNPQVIYAVVRHYSWGIYEGDKLYRSINGGGNWTQINKGLPRPFLSEYLYPISAIAISPSNPNILYIGTSGFHPKAFAPSRGKGVFKSTDGGLEWVAVGGPHPGGKIFNYLDISSMVVHPTNPDIVYVGTFSEGIWRTTTGGGKGFLDWGRVRLSLGDVVRKVNALAISPANPDIIYAAAYNFDPFGPPIPKIPPIGLLVDNYFIRSEEGGRFDTWQELSLGYAFMPQIDDIFIDNKDPNIVYIVTSDFTVYKSSDGGENWNNISGIEGANPLPPSPFVQKRAKKSITVHPELSDVIFVGRQRVIGIEAGEWVLTTRGVYFTPNAGKDWLASDLQECIEELVFSSDGNSHILYAAGPHGLWRIDLSKGLAAMRLRSPGELRVYDSQGRVTGLVDGVVKQEIPHSVYDAENKIVTILSPIDTYRFVVAGVEKGEFGLTIALAHDRNVAPFTVADIPTSAHTTHQYTIDWDLLAQEDRGATVQIDADGDGVFEEKIELQLPRPSFIYSPVSPSVGQTITFDASYSYDPDGNITSYRWDFGDGVTEVGKTTSHSFPWAGNYRVTLSVTDNDGVVSTSSKVVTVAAHAPDPVDPAPDPVDPTPD
ncbi:PKD domain-containing protein, partial [Thermodesulfovibrionales bacterium]|nr:PKD domain-containing protein [Thermodesulfovibrionales bacterium]